MQPLPDLYASLGVEPSATLEEIRQAFREAARRFHPDANPDPSALEEFKVISQAHDILTDPQRRADYDARAAPRRQPPFSVELTSSRTSLHRNPEPQTLYLLADIRAELPEKLPDPPLNICLVIDRSTSMQGQRLDQVKAAAQQIINSLQPNDIFAVVTFSDRPEIALPAQAAVNKAAAISKVSAISAGGGTEILQGLLCGLAELQKNLSPSTVNQLILLTDGRTYGDEDDCLLLAMLAEADSITISGLGIGDEWNDAFLDRLAAATGGQSQYVNSPAVVTRLLTEQVRGIGRVLAQRLRLQVSCDPEVKLKSALRVSPETQLLPLDSQPLKLGHLLRDQPVSVLLEFVVKAAGADRQYLARLWVIGDVIDVGRVDEKILVDVNVSLADAAPSQPPPLAIVQALDKLTLYRLQEKAWSAVESGDISLATRRLQTFATRLLAAGETELANLALTEAERLGRSQQVSAEARKRIKYGTRALIAPPSSAS